MIYLSFRRCQFIWFWLLPQKYNLARCWMPEQLNLSNGSTNGLGFFGYRRGLEIITTPYLPVILSYYIVILLHTAVHTINSWSSVYIWCAKCEADYIHRLDTKTRLALNDPAFIIITGVIGMVDHFYLSLENKKSDKCLLETRKICNKLVTVQTHNVFENMTLMS